MPCALNPESEHERTIALLRVGWECRGVLAETSIREQKAILEGALSTRHTLLGFETDTATGIIGVPSSNVMGSRVMITSDVYSPGCGEMRLRDVQVLRGLRRRW